MDFYKLVEIVNSTTVRVVEHKDSSACKSYASFSHCWGTAETLQLVSENRSELQAGIRISDLPESYREALEVASSFDIRFIWIDSLCIIQDSVDDWRAEAATMCEVYQNAILNIAACAAAENSELSFRRRDHRVIPPPQVTPSWDDVKSERCFIASIDTWQQEVEESPLYRRSWVLQEARLSTRNLCLTSTQLWWGCRGGTCCESWPDGLPKGMDNAKGNERTDTLFTHFTWCDLVEKYTTCGITVLSDRMIAISGLATSYQKHFPGDEYIAGLWRSQLPQSLCWVSGPDAMLSMKYRTIQYRAPSWSWASVEGGVYFEHTRYGADGVQPVAVCEILDINISRTGPSSYGEIAGGSLRLCGPLAPVKARGSSLLFQQEDGEFAYIPETAEDKEEALLNDNDWTSIAFDEYTSYMEPIISHIDTSNANFGANGSLADTTRLTKLAGRWGGPDGQLFCLPVIQWDHPGRSEGAGIILAHPGREPPGRYQRVAAFRWNGNIVRDFMKTFASKEFTIV